MQKVNRALAEKVIRCAQVAGGIVYGSAVRELVLGQGNQKMQIYIQGGEPALAKFRLALHNVHIWIQGKNEIARPCEYGHLHKFRCAFYLPGVLRDALGGLFDLGLELDIVLAGAAATSFGVTLDLECNGITITPEDEYKLLPCLTRNLKNPDAKLAALHRIVDDVKQKQTTLLSHRACTSTIQELVDQKWTIRGNGCAIGWHTYENIKENEDVCSICLCTFSHTEPAIKVNCCRGHIHPACANLWTQKSRTLDLCPRCNSGPPAFYIDERDILLIRALN